jgi:hypothetical protein
MPNQVDITVKKADGTTDITYSKVVPSAGNSSPAKWQGPIGAALAHKPVLQVKSSANAQNTVRFIEISFLYPETVTGTDGKTSVVNRLGYTIRVVRPTDMSDAVVAEAVAQGTNLFASAHVKAMLNEGYAAT